MLRAKKNKISRLDKYFKIAGILISIIFLLQAFSVINIISVFTVLKILGLKSDIFGLVLSILFSVLILIFIMVLASIIKINNFEGRVKRNTIILKMIVQIFMAIITFLPAFFSFTILSGVGVFGKVVSHSSDLNIGMIFLNQFFNIYLFWFFLIRTFVKPEIAPEWGEDKDSLESK